MGSLQRDRGCRSRHAACALRLSIGPCLSGLLPRLLGLVPAGSDRVVRLEKLNLRLNFLRVVQDDAATFNEDVSAQLPLGSLFGSFNQSSRGPPEKPSRYTENNGEQRNDGFAVLVKPLAATSPADFVKNQETADVFLRGALGCMLLMLLYAGMKRW